MAPPLAVNFSASVKMQYQHSGWVEKRIVWLVVQAGPPVRNFLQRFPSFFRSWNGGRSFPRTP